MTGRSVLFVCCSCNGLVFLYRFGGRSFLAGETVWGIVRSGIGRGRKDGKICFGLRFARSTCGTEPNDGSGREQQNGSGRTPDDGAAAAVGGVDLRCNLSPNSGAWGMGDFAEGSAQKAGGGIFPDILADAIPNPFLGAKFEVLEFVAEVSVFI